MDDDTPHDPNQVLCSCGRLVRVFPAIVDPERVTIIDCQFVFDGLCEECQGGGMITRI